MVVFPVVRVDSSRAESLEPLGTKRKFWFSDDQGRRMLFKAEDRGTGEDWAEKVACEVSRLLGLAHVHYELAVESAGDRPGVVCENCAPPPTELLLGNQLLLECDPTYPADLGRRYKVREHTVEAVTSVMKSLAPPTKQWTTGTPEGIASALDVFVGYVMLDAWIANQDRHHENWGALRVGDALHLAPTFDHGASLARNLTDGERHERMTTRDAGRQIGRFVRRARSAFYETPTARRPMTTVQAWRNFSRESPEACTIWLERLRAIDDDMVRGLLSQVPPTRLSRIGREFTLQLLLENRQRLLGGDDS